MDKLYIYDKDFKKQINDTIYRINQIYGNKVIFEEYIIIPKLNNIVMLRFKLKDNYKPTINELYKLENSIRELIFPDYLANFMGEVYQKYGLSIEDLYDTLTKVSENIPEVKFDLFPSYFEMIEEDIKTIKKNTSSIDIEVWEFQINDNSMDVLLFANEKINKELIINNIKIILQSKSYDSSYVGIILAEITAIKNKTSLVEILLKYQ